jgi:hypothetical protein
MTWTSNIFADFYSFQLILKLKNRCSHVIFAIIAVKLMRIDTSRAVVEHHCGSDMYQLDANCLVKRPKYVTMPSVCQSILITHWLWNRWQHLLWRHLRGIYTIKAIDLYKNVMNCSMYVVETLHTRQQWPGIWNLPLWSQNILQKGYFEWEIHRLSQ